MMTKIKICGLRRLKDIEIINEVKPEFAGFVFARSPRQVDEKLSFQLREKMDPAVKAVGVFVNEPVWRVAAIGRAGIIQMIQLHGDEDASYIEEIRMKAAGIPIIKAVRVRSADDIIKAAELDVDYLLLDTFVKGVYGGSGISFDKKFIPEMNKPYFLAGGLTAENVKENIRICHPFAVDTSSAMETDGIKDADKIRKFVERVRNNE